MRSTAHLHSATIALLFIYHLNSQVDTLIGVFFLFGVMGLDADFILAKIVFKIQNHRDFITHNIFVYLILLPIAYSFNPYLFWLILGAIYHLLFDLFDWGLPLKPTSIVTPHILIVPESKEEVYFFKTYFNNIVIRFVEIVLFSGFLATLLQFDNVLIYFILVIELVVLAEFFYQIFRLKQLNSVSPKLVNM